MTEVSLSLVIVTLIAGMTGCVGGSTQGVQYDLTIASGEGGSVTVPGEGTFGCDAGRVVELVAVPTSGYLFDRWTGDVDTIANVNAASTTITVNGDYSIRANFEEAEGTYYTLTVAVTGSGSTSPTVGQHTYAAGAVISISATPTSGYQFVNWIGDVSTIGDPDSTSTTITIYGNYSITAKFEGIPTSQYSLTISSTTGGSVTVTISGEDTVVGPGQTQTIADITGGTEVYLEATPDVVYHFVNWAGAPVNGITSATTSFSMQSDYSITANFAEGPPPPPGEHSLTISSTAGGWVSTPGQGTFTYDAGTVVNLVATPLGGYYFVNWTATAGSFANAGSATTTFTMPAQTVAVTANFALIPPGQYSLSISSTSGGSVTTPGEGTFIRSAGTVVNLVASPVGGYQFVNWTGDVATIADVNDATTTITTNSNYSITANFEVISPIQYSLTISSTAGGSVTVPGEGTFTRNAGTLVNLVATPASGYAFVSWTGNVGTIADVNAASTTITMNSNCSITANFETVNFMISAGDLHTVGVKSDGRVVAVGNNVHGQCNVGGWTGAIQAAAGGYHTVGLKSGGTVVATGNNQYGQCNVGGWANIVQIAAGGYHTVGLKSDGTVAAVGYNYWGQCDIGGWTNIIQVAAGGFHTVGLKSDGTVVATGNNWYGQRNVSGWTNIIQVAAGDTQTVGLKSNGTVVAVGDNAHGQCNVGSWTNIIQVAAGGSYTVGLRANGTAVAVGDNHHGQCNVSGWTNTIQVSAGWQHTVGLKSDGTLVATGNNQYGQCSVGGWDLN
jgi:preprotein translocase subunit YajC